MNIYQENPPLCPICDTILKWSIRYKRWQKYCSQSCTRKSSIAKANQAAASEQAKQKRKHTFRTKYGVDNASHIDIVRQKISDSKKGWWQEIRGNKDYTTDGLSLVEYQHRVEQYSNTEYFTHIDKIDPNRLRGKYFHLDHVYSKFDGFKYDVPVDVLSHWTNLKIIPANDNLRKNRSSDKTLDQLFEDYHQSLVY